MILCAAHAASERGRGPRLLCIYHNDNCARREGAQGSGHSEASNGTSVES